VIGEVTAVDAAAGKIQIKSDAGASYAVKLDDKTTYLRIPPGEKDLKKAEHIALADIGAGDRVLARGPVSEQDKTVAATSVIVMSKTELAKKHEADRAEWQHRGISGVVAAVNPQTNEVTMAPRGRADAKPVTIDASGSKFRRYAADSVRFSDAKPSTFTELKAGDQLRALGDKNEDGTRLKAEEIVSGTFQTLAATVISVDSATGVVKVTDLQTKKPVDIRTNPDSLLRRVPEMMATMMAQRLQSNPDGAAAGAPGGPGRPGGSAAPPAQGTPAGPGGPPEGRGGPGGSPGGRGGPGGPGRGNFDFQQMLERMPALSLAELKPGDALIVSSAQGADRSNATAITLIAGVEPFLRAAPRTAGQVNLGAWSFDIGAPAQ
jgi:Cu/Ag efflux protein CusF